MTQAVGATLVGYPNLNTQISSLTDNADIVKAFRTYHYGSSTFDQTKTNPAEIPAASIAGQLYALWQQLSTLSGNLGLPYAEYTTKGDILTTTGVGNSTNVQPLAVGTNGQVLSANSATTTGLQWITPYSTPTIGSTSITSGTATTTINGLTLGTSTTLNSPTINTPTLSAPTVTQLYLSDSVIIFEGATADAFETTLTVVDPTADRTITFPNIDGTVITTGNLSSITTVGTVTAGSFPAANLTGTTLSSTVVSSSLTSVGILNSLNVTNAINAGSIYTTGSIIDHMTINAPATLPYTLVLLDDGKFVELNSASANILTVPLNSSVAFPIGTQVNIIQTGTGQVTVAGAVGVTVNGTPGLKLRAQWSAATLYKRATDTWVLIGDIAA